MQPFPKELAWYNWVTGLSLVGVVIGIALVWLNLMANVDPDLKSWFREFGLKTAIYAGEIGALLLWLSAGGVRVGFVGSRALVRYWAGREIEPAIVFAIRELAPFLKDDHNPEAYRKALTDVARQYKVPRSELKARFEEDKRYNPAHKRMVLLAWSLVMCSAIVMATFLVLWLVCPSVFDVKLVVELAGTLFLSFVVGGGLVLLLVVPDLIDSYYWSPKEEKMGKLVTSLALRFFMDEISRGAPLTEGKLKSVAELNRVSWDGLKVAVEEEREAYTLAREQTGLIS